MSIHTVAALLSLVAILLLATVFLRVRILAHESRNYAPVQSNAYRIRNIGFWILLLVGLPITIWLFRENPYTAQAAAPQVINATGYQWYWDLDRDEVAAGTPVEFHVASADVNHGFGIYDEGGTLVAQTQAMPGYVNRLTHVFDAPGTYQILCLEYCGLVHHSMIAEILVTEGSTDG